MTAAIKRSDPKYLQINASSLRETESPLVPDSRSGIAAPSLQPGELDRLYRSLFEVTPEDHPRTARLLASSNRKTAQKVIEEAGEVALEAVKHHARGIVREICSTTSLRYGIAPASIHRMYGLRCTVAPTRLALPKSCPKPAPRSSLLNPERQATDQNSTGGLQADADGHAVRLSDLSAATDDEGLAAMINPLVAELREKMNVDYGVAYENLLNAANEKLTRPLKDGFRMEGHLSSAKLEKTYLSADDIVIALRASGELKILYGM
jgi:hypothetical protein